MDIVTASMYVSGEFELLSHSPGVFVGLEDILQLIYDNENTELWSDWLEPLQKKLLALRLDKPENSITEDDWEDFWEDMDEDRNYGLRFGPKSITAWIDAA